MPNAPPIHRPLGYVTRQARQREFDSKRGTTAERGYGARWRKVRLIQLNIESLCRFCKERGVLKEADEVDHIDGDSRNNRGDNLRSLCKPCHSSRTAKDQGFAKGVNGA